MYEEVKIEKVEGYCKLCEDYAQKNMTNPAKAAIMSCEGACARGEVSRRAANLIAHKLAPENTVRICLGGAFTKDGGQRNLVRGTHQAIAIEGCFVNCASRMMRGVIPDLKPVVINADTLYETCLPFGVDEVCDEEINNNAQIVAEIIIKKYINGCRQDTAIGECAASGRSSKSTCCGG